jgi:hypothetical protein
MKARRRRREEVILLNDLAPQREIKGGTGSRVFGESPAAEERPEEAPANRKTGRRAAATRPKG